MLLPEGTPGARLDPSTKGSSSGQRVLSGFWSSPPSVLLLVKEVPPKLCTPQGGILRLCPHLHK